MCGIFAYVGRQECARILHKGLERLEYRGYDSSGIATLHNGSLHCAKEKGRVHLLSSHLSALPGSVGVAHTRWATHGEPNMLNAHPHSSGHISVVHNGIIENFESLKTYLESKGYVFVSETDSEVIVHLIHHLESSSHTSSISSSSSFLDAFRLACTKLDGAYGIVALSSDHPDSLFIARKGSPLVVGVADGAHLVASDPSALVEHTRNVMYIDDGIMGELTSDSHSFSTIAQGEDHLPESSCIDWDVETIEKAGYDYFMLKEIFEQPKAVKDAFSSRLRKLFSGGMVSGLNLTSSQALKISRVVITACGTSWHAALVAKNYFESITHLPTEVDYASELRYRNALIDENTLVIAISQSGETADTLEALRVCKKLGAFTVGIVNVVGSTISREVDGGLYVHAGPEIGVASTKAFTTQLVVSLVVALSLASLRNSFSSDDFVGLLEASIQLPGDIECALSSYEQIKSFAPSFKDATNALYLGRGLHFPVALEGALKLKEISYIHAEGLPAAEMKHGSIALIDKDMPVIVTAPNDSLYQKVLSNIQEVKARGGRIIAISTKEDSHLSALAEHTIIIPKTHRLLQPILSTIPLQLLAYELAVLRGCDVDKPRNLAKSVTVE